MKTTYSIFDNLDGLTNSLCVRSISQDHNGMMWFASESGLYSYDGYNLHRRRVLVEDGKGKSSEFCAFNCMLVLEDTIILGSDHGLISFDMKTHHSSFLDYGRDEKVHVILKAAGHVWTGTESALYRDSKAYSRELGDINALFATDSVLFIGTVGGSYKYSFSTHKYEKLPDEIFLSTCFYSKDGEDKKLWIGTMNRMLQLDMSNGTIPFSKFVPVAKSISTDDEGNVLVGTDDGLFVLDKEMNMTSIRHDARFSLSLSGDAVWCIYKDKTGNIWLGTNGGISMIPHNPVLRTFPLYDITGEGSGHRMTVVGTDSNNRFWLGGSNGLVCVENLGTSSQTYRWYRMSDMNYHLVHNSVRAFKEDSHHRVWIGGDMGLLYYNEETSQFEFFDIVEENLDWIYDIDEKDGKLFVTTFNNSYLAEPDFKTHKLNVEKRFAKKDIGDRQIYLDSIVSHFGLSENYLSCYEDKRTGKILLGGIDGFSILDSKKYNVDDKDIKLLITDIIIDGDRYLSNDSVLAGKARLSYKENNIEFLFSDFDYSDILPDDYSYYLKGAENRWIKLRGAERGIFLPNLSSGEYKLYILPTRQVQDSCLDDLQPVYEFVISAPWYATNTAFVIYVLLFIALAYGIYMFVQQKKKLKAERGKREEIIANAKEKERQLLSENEYLTNQLRVRMLEKAGMDNEMSADDKLLLEITKIIEDNMDNPELNVSLLSEKCGVSQKQLYRKLKAITGMTTVAYIRDQRLKKAASLLGRKGFTVSEVMYMVGFTNSSYFSRCFMEEYGKSPSEYEV
ncbi:MAG: helix-turn-helix domain-containing protein [Bacteroidaceae bacterium]|nr:helix-turn-helix domain-containing protein [Bacteroidaceae bacterium]